MISAKWYSQTSSRNSKGRSVKRIVAATSPFSRADVSLRRSFFVSLVLCLRVGLGASESKWDVPVCDQLVQLLQRALVLVWKTHVACEGVV